MRFIDNAPAWVFYPIVGALVLFGVSLLVGWGK